VILLDSAVFLTKDERSYDSDSLLFITVFFKADGALYSRPPLNHTFSPEFKESHKGRGLRREWGGGEKKKHTDLWE